MSNNFIERLKDAFLSPANCQWILLMGLWFMMLSVLINHQWASSQAQDMDNRLESLRGRLQSMTSYDLDRLQEPSQKIAQLGRMSSVQNQNIKFVSEATTESRKLKEIPYSMPSFMTVSGSSLLHILDILHPAKEPGAPVDLWVKYLKIRKDRDHFSLQMSLISRELKP